MKRQDYIIFFLLIALLFAWPGIYQKFLADKNPPVPEATAEPASGPAEAVTSDEDSVAAPDVAALKSTENAAAAADVAEDVAEDEPVDEEVLGMLTNGSIRLVVSSRGASVMQATLVSYREALPSDSSLMTFDFSRMPALAYSGIPGLSTKNDFRLEVDAAGNRAVFDRTAAGGLNFRREISLGEDYLVTVKDTFINESPSLIEIGQHQIQVGPIPEETAHVDLAGMINMGVDSLPPAGSVENWGKVIPKQFKNIREETGAAALPQEINWKPAPKPADWVAAKNKYFVQILKPDGDGADWIEIYARRKITADELNGRRAKDAIVDAVGAKLGFNSQVLAAGEEYTRTFEYYIGPKNFGMLSKLSHGREGAMGFEENAYMDFIVVPTAKLLLRLLNLLHDHVYANYGVAIILLTLIVKIVFWPITHKGTESMRRMASVQPEMAHIREKYKDNPQKMQQAMMALYKEHKINPIGGCLPMLVQIPVFFALFVVLRIAIELRFADFLWIHDLSAPERIFEFGFAIPLLGWDALNILPLLMTITMVIQQKMTPTAGDPQQQKIMMIMMPAMMLFFLYNFASGLALYWTTQNVLMIVQQLLYKQRKKHEGKA